MTVATCSTVALAVQVCTSSFMTSSTVAPTALRNSSSKRSSAPGHSMTAPRIVTAVGMCSRDSWTIRSSSSKSPTTRLSSSTTGAPPMPFSRRARAATSTRSPGWKAITSVVMISATKRSRATGRVRYRTMDLGISGRRAAVAAASSGLGFATAQALHAEGVQVAICGRDKARIHDAAERLPGSVPLVADVSTADGATAFVEEAIEALGGVDILVTNAGGPPPGNFASTPVDRYPDALALNLMSVVAMCHAAVPAIPEQRSGPVLAITSITVRQPSPVLILSNTARAGATAFLKTLATEVAPDGVTVTSLQPGIHATARAQSLHGGDEAAMTRGIPAQMVGRPEDFGAVAAFLCSEPARFITGAAVHVDGGAYAGLQ